GEELPVHLAHEVVEGSRGLLRRRGDEGVGLRGERLLAPCLFVILESLARVLRELLLHPRRDLLPRGVERKVVEERQRCRARHDVLLAASLGGGRRAAGSERRAREASENGE